MTGRIPTRVAVTSRSFSKNDELVSALRDRVDHVTINADGDVLRGDELRSFLQGHDGAIVALEALDRSVLDGVPELRVVSKYGVGLDSLDLAAFEAVDVWLGWTPGVNRHSVAELTLAAMISLLHRVPEATSDVRNGHWRQWRGTQLGGKTVGVVGCGNIGKEVVRLLEPFGCRVVVTDIRDYPKFYERYRIEPVSLERLLEESDVVTLHVPLDSTTLGMINRAALERMRHGAVLLNFARGGLIDEATLLDRVDSGALGGAALDVLEHEPPRDRRLLEHPRTLVTPHIGGSTQEAVRAMGMAAIEGLFTARSVATWKSSGVLP